MGVKAIIWAARRCKSSREAFEVIVPLLFLENVEGDFAVEDLLGPCCLGPDEVEEEEMSSSSATWESAFMRIRESDRLRVTGGGGG